MIGPLQPTRPRSTAAPAAGSAKGEPPADGNDHAAADQEALLAQQATFNFQVQERAELLREFNELRALQMEQLKHDDEIVKKWIELI